MRCAAWAHYECALDARGAVACKYLHRVDDVGPMKAVKMSGFPAPARAIVGGHAGNEGGPIFCAVGVSGDVACTPDAQLNDAWGTAHSLGFHP
ncbi:hypothetical protein BH09MYX1_BH09MYX1_19040 [soil metagenome]